jgi:hypothetical protein
MTKDEVSALFLIVTLAVCVAVHVSIAAKLTGMAPRWRGVVALLIPPLSPFWAWRSGLRARAVVWVVALAGWGVARLVLAR